MFVQWNETEFSTEQMSMVKVLGYFCLWKLSSLCWDFFDVFQRQISKFIGFI